MEPQKVEALTKGERFSLPLKLFREKKKNLKRYV